MSSKRKLREDLEKAETERDAALAGWFNCLGEESYDREHAIRELRARAPQEAQPRGEGDESQ